MDVQAKNAPIMPVFITLKRVKCWQNSFGTNLPAVLSLHMATIINSPKDRFSKKFFGEGFTFDDVLLVPAHSKVLPREVDIKTRLTKKIALNIRRKIFSLGAIHRRRLLKSWSLRLALRRLRRQPLASESEGEAAWRNRRTRSSRSSS